MFEIYNKISRGLCFPCYNTSNKNQYPKQNLIQYYRCGNELAESTCKIKFIEFFFDRSIGHILISKYFDRTDRVKVSSFTMIMPKIS